MAIVNNTPDDEIVSGSSVANTLPSNWEQFIAKITNIINDYDHVDDITQIDDTDPFFADEDEIVWDFETKTNFDFGWSCRC